MTYDKKTRLYCFWVKCIGIILTKDSVFVSLLSIKIEGEGILESTMKKDNIKMK